MERDSGVRVRERVRVRVSASVKECVGIEIFVEWVLGKGRELPRRL